MLKTQILEERHQDAILVHLMSIPLEGHEILFGRVLEMSEMTGIAKSIDWKNFPATAMRPVDQDDDSLIYGFGRLKVTTRDKRSFGDVLVCSDAFLAGEDAAVIVEKLFLETCRQASQQKLGAFLLHVLPWTNGIEAIAGKLGYTITEKDGKLLAVLKTPAAVPERPAPRGSVPERPASGRAGKAAVPASKPVQSERLLEPASLAQMQEMLVGATVITKRDDYLMILRDGAYFKLLRPKATAAA